MIRFIIYYREVDRDMKKFISGAVVLLLAMAMFFSSIAIADTQIKQTNFETNTTNEGTGQGARGAIVWDNGMEYTGLGAAQWDEPGQFDAYLADDFLFEEPTEVCDVHWIGGYWNPAGPNEFDWGISFYLDDGTGNAPIGTPYLPSFAGPFIYAWAEIETTELELGYYEMSVDLPENIPFGEGKYWISIWGIGTFPPAQSGWGLHDDQILLHEAVFGSDYFGFAFWTDSFDVFGYSADMCFQLTTKQEAIPLICCDPMVMSWDNVKPGDTVEGKFHVWNCGDEGSSLSWQVDSWPDWMTDGGVVFTPASGTEVYGGPGTEVSFTFTAPAEEEQTYSGKVKVINTDDPSDYCDMPVELKTPRTRGIFFNFLEYIVNQFPMLKALFGF
jgi:hypothetical protein